MTWKHSAKALLWGGWIAFWLSASWMPGRVAVPVVLHPDDLLAFNSQQLCGWPQAQKDHSEHEHCALCWVLPQLALQPPPPELPPALNAAKATAAHQTLGSKTLLGQRSRSPPVA